MAENTFTIIHHGGSGDWSAVYDARGNLVKHGDTSNCEEYIFSQFGVEEDYNPSVFRNMKKDPKDKYGTDTPAATLKELAKWTAEDEDAKQKVLDLRAEADRLEKELKTR